MAKSKNLTAAPDAAILTGDRASDAADAAIESLTVAVAAVEKRFARLDESKALGQSLLHAYATIAETMKALEKTVDTLKARVIAHIEANGEIEKGAYAVALQVTEARRPKYKELAASYAEEIAKSKGVPFTVKEWERILLESTPVSVSKSLKILKSDG